MVLDWLQFMPTKKRDGTLENMLRFITELYGGNSPALIPAENTFLPSWGESSEEPRHLIFNMTKLEVSKPLQTFSLADVLEPQLLCANRGAASKRTVSFYSGLGCTRLLTTTASSKRFNRGNSTKEFKDSALSFVPDILEREINALVSSRGS